MDVIKTYEENPDEELNLLDEEIDGLTFKETIIVKLYDMDSELMGQEVYAVLDSYEDAIEQIDLLNREDVARVVDISSNTSFADIYLENCQYDGDALIFEETIKIKTIKF